MTDWNKIGKVSDITPMLNGISTIFPVVPRGAGAGLAIGFSEFVPGSIEIDVPQSECFLVTQGELEIASDDEKWTVRQGEGIWMPAGSKVVATAKADCSVVYVILLS